MVLKKVFSSFVAGVGRKFFLSVESVLFFFSLLTMAAVTVDYGFQLDDDERRTVGCICDFALWVYFCVFLVRLFVYRIRIRGRMVFFSFLMGGALLLALLPDFSGSDSGFVYRVFGGEVYRLVVLSVFSLLELSKGVTAFIGRRTNPALLLASCFLVLILFGALLLLLPRSTLEGVRLSVIDALFVSTSAVCVTGLSTVEVAQT